MAPLREIDANRRLKKPASQKVPARSTKLLSKTPSIDEVFPQSFNTSVQTLDQAARAMTEKLSKKRTFGEVEDEAIPETDVEASTQSQRLPPPASGVPNTSNLVASLEEDDEIESQVMVYNCDQIRKKITAYLKTGEMKVKDFQNKLGVSASSYYSFTKEHGASAGENSDTFWEAQKFFVDREKKGIKTPPAKKARTSKQSANEPDPDKENEDPTPTSSPSSNKKTKKDDKADKYDVTGIELPLENLGRVPVFDTCDDIRTKIRQHLRTSGQSQAAFGRLIGETYAVARHAGTDADAPAVAGRSITQFLAKKGPAAGNTSQAFYAAYVYFEKLRVKNKRDKTKKRREMEEVHGPDGMDVEILSTKPVTCAAGFRPCVDKYGKMEILPSGAFGRRRGW